MIQIRGLTKIYNGVPVLNGIDLDIKKGERIAIIGPSGTGKSTLLRCLNFLETPEQGEYVLDGKSIDVQKANSAQIKEMRLRTAFVFQNYALFANKTARENIAEGLITVRGEAKETAFERADEILRDIGLADKTDAYPASLSGGQQQRVGIGRAMASNSELMLVDEPTSALDPEWVDEVLQLLTRVAQAHQTMLIVTHEMAFAKEIADRVLFMEGGRIVEQGPPEKIFTSPDDPRTRSFLRKVL
ncbi:putative amino-acid import ATP-binding protein YxeO [Pseudovibrio sp. W64]|uniref:amino acid ABC transporter ATP-binding protein n=1 Tax=unclassified Pseudovibrio TaxID=2627060 RepID=UPI0007AECE2E|nr:MULTISPECIES: amino acid ABC transporter ATP-binding protein [unclassified Pseudovibrio]KZK80993.1 putative amino-acid import ATP-binding protein YxeO [Pseudovibrio sp. W64]KZK98101.1 putative amino-acid import ATP-binding protein YxeO [Pseudovibrio sp. Ad5]KZL00866.1 putative amino-acid import ATP-binding protein YxeO [Pseudovibrio sp. W74]KZL04444.1 putative amino-acid import ATP-binding protein YxeO [Pseudovibrio sp. Ad14]